MHESGLIRNLVRKVEDLAGAEGAKKVVSVRVKFGPLSPISPEHFLEHFDRETKGTLAEGARLEAEVTTDLSDPLAQDVVLDSFEVEKEVNA